jgi:hypothetical protein
VEDRRNKHDRIYLILLIVLAFWSLLGMGTMFFILHSPVMHEENRWVIAMNIYVQACYLAAIALTVVIRIAAPSKAGVPTTALNIVLLLYVPLGTALGVYGLWKVGKTALPPQIPMT